MAAGRYTSVPTIRQERSCLRRYKANLAVAVVLPVPCKPAIRITVGGF